MLQISTSDWTLLKNIFSVPLVPQAVRLVW